MNLIFHSNDEINGPSVALKGKIIMMMMIIAVCFLSFLILPQSPGGLLQFYQQLLATTKGLFQSIILVL